MKRHLVMLALLLIAPSVAAAQTPTSDHIQPTIAGTALELLPNTDNGEVEVIAFGPISRFGELPVVVRNNTSDVVAGVVVKVEARDADGKLIGVGESSEFIFGLAPYVLNPGDVSIGTVRLEGEMPSDAEFTFSARAGDPDGFFAGLTADIEFGQIEWIQDRIVGEAINPHDVDLSGVSLQVGCFDADGSPLFVKLEFLTGDDIAAGETSTFQVGGSYTDYDQCENFLISGSGTPED